MATVYVARHGETDWNRTGRYQGQRESQLTPLGTLQASALARELGKSGAGRVLSSPLRRCARTAAPLAAELGVPLETDPRLLEIAHGTWEGRLREDIERDDPATMLAWRQAPATVRFVNGESLADVDARWREFAASLDGTHGAVAVVTHDVLVRVAILAATGQPLCDLWKPRVENGGYAVFTTSFGEGWQLVDECRREHLSGIGADTSLQAL